MPERAAVEIELQELRALRHDFAGGDAADAQVQLLEVRERNLGFEGGRGGGRGRLGLLLRARGLVLRGARLVGDFAGVGGLHLRLLHHRLNLLRVDARGEVLVLGDRGVLDRSRGVLPGVGGLAEECGDLLRVDGEDGLQVDREDAEDVEDRREGGAGRLGAVGGLDGLPGLAAVEVLVRGVGDLRHLHGDLRKTAVLVVAGDRVRAAAGEGDEFGALRVKRPEAAFEVLVEHLRAARGEVRDLAHEVAVHALHEVL